MKHVFWRVDFKIENGVIRLYQTIAIWEIIGGLPPRILAQREYNLIGGDPAVTYPNGMPAIAYIQNETNRSFWRATFDAGQQQYIYCQTVDLNWAVTDMGHSDLAQDARLEWPTSELTELRGRENIGWHALVSTNGAGLPLYQVSLDASLARYDLNEYEQVVQISASEPNHRLQPFFFIAQPEYGYILGAEITTDYAEPTRQTLFARKPSVGGLLSGTDFGACSQPYMVSPLYPPERGTSPEQAGSLRQIHARQDGDQENNSYLKYLEFWIDNIPLGIYPLTEWEIPCKTEPADIFIGCFPYDLNDLSTWVYLNGSICDMVFDPHGACPGCD